MSLKPIWIDSLDEVDMIVLENTGELTVIEKITQGEINTFEDVKIEIG